MFEFGKYDKSELIDAVAEIKRSKEERLGKEASDTPIEEACGASRLGSEHRRLPAGSKTFLSLILICALAICGVLIWKAWEVRSFKQKTATVDNRPVSNNLPPLILPSLTISKSAAVLEEEIKENKDFNPEAQQQVAADITLLQRLFIIRFDC